MIKLLVSDLDHTLLNEEKTVDANVQSSIKQLINSGVEIGLASGRVDGEIKQVGDQFLQHACHRISENGVFVYTADGEELFSTQLPDEVILPIFELIKPYDLLTVFNTQKQCYVQEKTAYLTEYEANTDVTIHEVPGLLDRIDDFLPLTKIAAIGELAELKRLEQQLIQHFTDQINFYISSPNCLDMVPKQSSKGIGIEKLMSKYNIKADEIACVGDSYNDIPMFQLTPHSFAMAHGEKQVRDSANYTVHSISEVADYILQYNQTAILK